MKSLSSLILVAFFALFLFISLACSETNSNTSEQPEDQKEVSETTTDTDKLDSIDASENTLIYPGEKHLANMRQITFNGQNAEAYFNTDGTRLIMQAHKVEGECDQIFMIDLQTGEQKMVSTGGGVCASSFFRHPSDDMILYCSTHHNKKECPEMIEMGKGLIHWKFHPEMDIFTANPDGSNLKQITDAWGYDAESSFAFDGSSIVFTSLSTGDPEIWTMDIDGSNKKQLTHSPGYDGGPFFSWDGTKITYRAYYPKDDDEMNDFKKTLKEQFGIKPTLLQLWVMDSDGSNKVQITDNGAVNFCPFFMPGDKKIIYVSNLGSKSPMGFNLWIVDIDGSNPEQVTFFEGFDAFPMFSRDGKKLTFTSSRSGKSRRDMHIFVCDWVD